ncbi:hypothetical protein GUITHDRAFT_116057 [Guillardia theta CCMP2712]|uniref:Carbohydrate kinase PfkB domain-containing protein n=1 Tax=Guillardia theta (strain CCMP2712) TaxID=905079 RepID=L1IPK3_GUITC|nr:hypothetical protein GUITHDRAFT_116057 [Guillardia theta CCMP2712]EKX37750.1 hypothetical protein GUITHDRAFT_116057 [Guillardia theta CCMP2712]|eukprot:XP_005824730.1 hypothetical protein GUITHDRAFT_116057 [Guillardia theta CCMP2712]
MVSCMPDASLARNSWRGLLRHPPPLPFDVHKAAQATSARLEEREICLDRTNIQRAAVLSMDGYHMYNAQIASEFQPSMKGLPSTFAARDLKRDLAALREFNDVLCPEYDRTLHEPVQDAISITKEFPIVIVEGNYLFLDEGDWSDLKGMFDLKLFISCSADASCSRVTKRKTRNGASAAEIEGAVPYVRQMAEIAERTAGNADARITFTDGETSESLSYLLKDVQVHQEEREPYLLAVGLNPAFQKTLVFDDIKFGDVNRAQKAYRTVGGKGQHVAIAANRIDVGSVRVAHFLGDEQEQGRFIHQHLKDRSIDQLVQWVPSSTRTCTTLLDMKTGKMTELIEPSDQISPEDVKSMIDKIVPAAQGCRGKRASVALCGTFPPGVTEEVYATLARSLPQDCKLVLDGPLKPPGGAGKDLDAAAKDCLERYLSPRAVLAITSGSSSAFLYRKEAVEGRGEQQSAAVVVTEFTIPQLEAVNPIGAGDTCTAGLLHGIVHDYPVEEAFAYALACASASCLHLEGANFDLRETLQLYDKITYEVVRKI